MKGTKQAILYLTVLFILSYSVMGLGISPSIVQLDDLARGGSYEKTYRLLNFDDVDVGANVIPTGAAENWTTIYIEETGEVLTDTIVVPAKGEKKIKVVFDLPNDVPNGMYQGYLDVKPVVVETGGSSVNIVVRGFYKLDVSGVENLAGEVDSITTKDTESGLPLRISYSFRNTGNVVAIADIDVSIYKNEELIDEFSTKSEAINAGKFKLLETLWDTENRGVGDFTADVKISLGGEELAKRTLKFNLAPRGTLTAEGMIGKVEAPDKWVQGSIGKTNVEFFNTGKIDVKAKIVGEVKKDGEIVEVINSEESLIKAGQGGELVFYYQPEESGDFEIVTKAVYSGKETEIDPLKISVRSIEEDTPNTEDFEEKGGINVMIIMLGAIVILLLALIVVLAAVFLKRK